MPELNIKLPQLPKLSPEGKKIFKILLLALMVVITLLLLVIGVNTVTALLIGCTMLVMGAILVAVTVSIWKAHYHIMDLWNIDSDFSEILSGILMGLAIFLGLFSATCNAADTNMALLEGGISILLFTFAAHLVTSIVYISATITYKVVSVIIADIVSQIKHGNNG